MWVVNRLVGEGFVIRVGKEVIKVKVLKSGKRVRFGVVAPDSVRFERVSTVDEGLPMHGVLGGQVCRDG